MVRRVCRAFGTGKNIVVLNDEAHHCYAPAPQEQAATRRLDADERTEARKDAEDARVWLDGLQAVRDKLGIRAVFDLSATPFFLKGSGYAEGTLFPWVVSRLRPDGRDRVRDREDPAGPGDRRLDDRRRARSTATSGSASATLCRKKGIKDTPIDGDPDHPQGARGRAPAPLRTTTSGPSTQWARAGMGHAARLHRRLLQHRRVASSSTTGSPAGSASCRDGIARSPCPATCALFSATSQDGRLREPPEHAPRRLGAARSRRRPRPRVQEGRGRRDRPSSSASTSPASRAAAPTTSPTRTSCARS